MEEVIKVLIYIHAFFGEIGLISGFGSILVKKGSLLHKIMGKLFSIGMIVSSLISIPIAWMPNHENLFLFLIGLFTIYLVISGNQILTFKSKSKQTANQIDKIISGSMLFLSIFMILFGIYGLVKGNSTYTLFVFFGGFGLSLTIRGFIFYKKYTNTNKAWLSNHIGKMIGAYIASVTTFIVAGLGIANLIAWMFPSVLGTFYIIYWRRKTKPKKQK